MADAGDLRRLNAFYLRLLRNIRFRNKSVCVKKIKQEADNELQCR